MLTVVLGAVGVVGAAAGVVALKSRPRICSVFPTGAAPLTHASAQGVVAYRMAWTVLPTDDVLVQFAMPGWAVEEVHGAQVRGHTLYVRVDAVRLQRGVPAPHTSFKVAVADPLRVREVVVLPLTGNRGRRVPYVAVPAGSWGPRQIVL